LLAAVAISLFANVLVIYVPFLQAGFHTVPLSAFDWLIATGVAAMLLVVIELQKLALRSKSRRIRRVTAEAGQAAPHSSVRHGEGGPKVMPSLEGH
jgi:hypothetical protein